MNFRNLLILSFLTAPLFGCSIHAGNAMNSKVESILIPEPQPANFRSQLAIARYNQILEQSSLSNDERAELMFSRGTHYDNVGLAGLAQYDFGMARQLKPDLAEAHNAIGIHYTQQMDFIEAYESFDSALEINPELDFAVLNRGIALYYGKRTDLAITDLNRFYSQDDDNPFAALWLFLAQRELDEKTAIEQLKLNRKRLDNGNWATIIVDFYLGNITRNKLLNDFVLEVKNLNELNQRMCEVYFYMGKYYGNKGQRGLALNYFKMVLSTNIYEYVEHRYSRIEIDLLRKQKKVNNS
ncbi:lipoprotein NlpI [Aliiglaciecola sp. LCG003]|uniref:lipoprotein NlpI n=1 Tax=Aliiglaciecola sp. LCG003 TaxID=3053655 RepID=UPI0025736C25|nr:lipoprotein NlpI [Aliiglaciecola sp. LCG003]WJG11280.1 lipoprotein NlpI [Aliiglaciecola sp. LCG003]